MRGSQYITGVAVAAVVALFVLSGPRGRNRYYPLVLGGLLTALACAYAARNAEPLYYLVAVAALAKGVWEYLRWGRV